MKAPVPKSLEEPVYKMEGGQVETNDGVDSSEVSAADSNDDFDEDEIDERSGSSDSVQSEAYRVFY